MPKARRIDYKFLIEVVFSLPARLLFALTNPVQGGLEIFFSNKKSGPLLRFFLLLVGIIGWIGIIHAIVGIEF